MVEGAYRLESIIKNGKYYIIRRCKQCQSDRVGKWNREHSRRVKAAKKGTSHD